MPLLDRFSHPPMTPSMAVIDAARTELMQALAKAEGDWLEEVCARELPPDVFLKAYGGEKTRLDAAKFLEENGYFLAIHPDGKREVRKGEKVIATAQFTIKFKT